MTLISYPPTCNDQGREALDLDLLTFIRRFANGELRWHIVACLALNPDAWLEARELASRLGRRYTLIEAELEDLALLGLLEVEDAGGKPRYRARRDPTLRQMLQRFRSQLIEERDPTLCSPEDSGAP